VGRKIKIYDYFVFVLGSTLPVRFIEMLSSNQLKEFNEDGFLILKKFYDIAVIDEIRLSIHKIIGIVIEHYKLDIAQQEFCPDHFDSSYVDLLCLDRRYGAIIYDAVKQIPAFNRLVNCKENQRLFACIRPQSLCAVASGGHGIRINNPNEEAYLAPWHQEYPAQLRSTSGLVFWAPLFDTMIENGPVEVAQGSHENGVLPVYFDGDLGNAYALNIHGILPILQKYEKIQPITEVGDLLVMDFCTIHKSGNNTSNRALWSMQFRWFDMLEATGITNNWKGSFASGVKFQDLHPELLIKRVEVGK
jgi:hypothetical protein